MKLIKSEMIVKLGGWSRSIVESKRKMYDTEITFRGYPVFLKIKPEYSKRILKTFRSFFLGLDPTNRWK